MWADLCYISEINGKTTFLFTVIKGITLMLYSLKNLVK